MAESVRYSSKDGAVYACIYTLDTLIVNPPVLAPQSKQQIRLLAWASDAYTDRPHVLFPNPDPWRLRSLPRLPPAAAVTRRRRRGPRHETEGHRRTEQNDRPRAPDLSAAPVRGRFQSDAPWRRTYANVPTGETAILHRALVFSFPFLFAASARHGSPAHELSDRSIDRRRRVRPFSRRVVSAARVRPARSVIGGGDELLRAAQPRSTGTAGMGRGFDGARKDFFFGRIVTYRRGTRGGGGPPRRERAACTVPYIARAGISSSTVSFLVSFGPGAPHGGGTVAIKMESVLWVVCGWGLVLLVLVRQVGVLRGTIC